MIIPRANRELRDRKVFDIRDVCMASLQERRSLYDLRRRFFLWGTDNNRTEIVKYNRLQAHLDLVASFLYAADNAKYSLSIGQNPEEALSQQAHAMQEDWNGQFRDSGLAYTVGEAILWSLVRDTMIIKMGWSDERDRLTGILVDPSTFGVYDESQVDIDDQEAFVHIYRLPWDNAVLRLLRAGLGSRIKDLNVTSGLRASEFPPVFQALMISSTGGADITGNVAGMAPATFTPVATYEARQDANAVEFQELWIWDDINEDYTVFTIVAPDIILTDSRDTIASLVRAGATPKAKLNTNSNPYLAGEHPFVPFTPFRLPDFFWGQAHCDRLMPLQRWTNERLDQIAEILEMQVDPAKVGSGFMGLDDDKMGALGGPGTFVYDQLPNAKVEFYKPEMPEDLFAEFKEIGHIFLEASGLTETILGKGEQGVRSGSQAKRLATTGSSRIRKIAVGLEEPLVRLGDLGIKLIQRNSTQKLRTKAGQDFLPSQFAADKWNLRIAGHSHSPLFADETREMALLLLKARAIDREMFIRMINPPNADQIVLELKKLEQKEMMAAQAKAALGAPAGGGPSRGNRQAA